MINWQKVETEYVTGDTSYAKLAKKYGVGRRAVTVRGKDGDWVRKREEYRAETTSKLIRKTQEKMVSDAEQCAAYLNEARVNICRQIAEKSRAELEPIDLQRLANTYQMLMPSETEKETVTQNIILLPKQEIVEKESTT